MRRAAASLAFLLALSLRAAWAQDCDTAAIANLAQQALPECTASQVGVRDGIVTLLLSRRGGGTLAVAAYTQGKALFTETMPAQLDDGERNRMAAAVAAWYDDLPMREALARCSAGARLPDPASALRPAVEAALSNHDRWVDDRGAIDRSLPHRKPGPRRSHSA